MNVVSLKMAYYTVLLLWWGEMIQCLCGEIKEGEWCRHCVIASGYYVNQDGQEIYSRVGYIVWIHLMKEWLAFWIGQIDIRDFLMLPRMAHRLKLMNCLFL